MSFVLWRMCSKSRGKSRLGLTRYAVRTVRSNLDSNKTELIALFLFGITDLSGGQLGQTFFEQYIGVSRSSSMVCFVPFRFLVCFGCFSSVHWERSEQKPDQTVCAKSASPRVFTVWLGFVRVCTGSIDKVRTVYLKVIHISCEPIWSVLPISSLLPRDFTILFQHTPEQSGVRCGMIMTVIILDGAQSAIGQIFRRGRNIVAGYGLIPSNLGRLIGQGPEGIEIVVLMTRFPGGQCSQLLFEQLDLGGILRSLGNMLWKALASCLMCKFDELVN